MPNERYLPSDVAVDSSGNIYISFSCLAGGAVGKYDANKNLIGKWPKSDQSPTLLPPLYGIALNSTGKVYATYTHGIKKLDPSSNSVTTVAEGSGTALNEFKYPEGIYLKNNYIYVVDHLNKRIKRLELDSTGNVIVTIAWLGNNNEGSNFIGPHGIAVDSAGRVYVTDSTSSSGGEVKVFNADGSRFYGKWAVSEVPYGIAVGPGGAVYVSTNNHIYKYTVTFQ